MKFVISDKDHGKLLRAYLQSIGVSAALCARLKRTQGGILLGGVPVTVRATVSAGDVLELALEEREPPMHVLPRDLPLEILYQSEDCIAVNKPAEMPTHPSHGHFEDTLANALAFHLSREDAPFRPRFINRLDRNTTGVVLVAAHALSASVLSRAMAQGEIQKTYLALVHGDVREARVIQTGIRRRAESIIFREVCPVGEGDLAITHVEPLAGNGELTLVRLVPKTGRTHQLRVQLSSIGHPLLGDDLYGCADGFSRHALHAATLEFRAPRGVERVRVRAPLTEDMRTVIAALGEEAIALAENA